MGGAQISRRFFYCVFVFIQKNVFGALYQANPRQIPLYNWALIKSRINFGIQTCFLKVANLFAIIPDLIPDEISPIVFSCFWSACIWICQLHRRNSPYPLALQAAHLHVPAMSRISPASTCVMTLSMSAARSHRDLSMYVPQIILPPLCRPWHHLPFDHICAACNPVLYASYLGFFQSTSEYQKSHMKVDTQT